MFHESNYASKSLEHLYISTDRNGWPRYTKENWKTEIFDLFTFHSMKDLADLHVMQAEGIVAP